MWRHLRRVKTMNDVTWYERYLETGEKYGWRHVLHTNIWRKQNDMWEEIDDVIDEFKVVWRHPLRINVACEIIDFTESYTPCLQSLRHASSCKHVRIFYQHEIMVCISVAWICCASYDNVYQPDWSERCVGISPYDISYTHNGTFNGEYITQARQINHCRR